MISKKELLSMMTGLRRKDGDIRFFYSDFMEWVNSLPDDQPDLLPFQWPIPDGMEVVTRDGRKVCQLTNFEAKEEDFPLIGVLGDRIEGWTFDGLYSNGTVDGRNDLFLRQKEKKVWVVDYDGVLDFYEDKEEANDHNESVYDGYAKVYQILVKPVV